jgi:7-keto-8-aminopelargonate synthetase-like enzyme
MPSVTPIQPLLIGANDEALRVSSELAARGVLVPAIRPPTVPEGTRGCAFRCLHRTASRISHSSSRHLREIGKKS